MKIFIKKLEENEKIGGIEIKKNTIGEIHPKEFIDKRNSLKIIL